MTESSLPPLPDDWEQALAVVAHPDDLEYGSAGAVAAWTGAGKKVTYLLVTRGEAGIDGMEPEKCAPLREAEERASASVVGVDQVLFLDHSDGVVEYGVPLRRDIAAIIRRVRPDLVLAFNPGTSWGPGTWNSPDHRAVGTATLDAVQDAGNRWIFPDAGDPWKARYVAVGGTPNPTHAVDITETFERAVASLAEHAAYLRGLGGEGTPEEEARKVLDFTIVQRSERFGGRPTVAFELIGG